MFSYFPALLKFSLYSPVIGNHLQVLVQITCQVNPVTPFCWGYCLEIYLSTHFGTFLLGSLFFTFSVSVGLLHKQDNFQVLHGLCMYSR